MKKPPGVFFQSRNVAEKFLVVPVPFQTAKILSRESEASEQGKLGLVTISILFYWLFEIKDQLYPFILDNIGIC